MSCDASWRQGEKAIFSLVQYSCESMDLHVFSLHPLPIGPVHTHSADLLPLLHPFCPIPKAFWQGSDFSAHSSVLKEKRRKTKDWEGCEGKALIALSQDRALCSGLRILFILLFFLSFFVSWCLKSNICSLLKECSTETHMLATLSHCSLLVLEPLFFSIFPSLRLLTMQGSSHRLLTTQFSPSKAFSHSPAS